MVKQLKKEEGNESYKRRNRNRTKAIKGGYDEYFELFYSKIEGQLKQK